MIILLLEFFQFYFGTYFQSLKKGKKAYAERPSLVFAYANGPATVIGFEWRHSSGEPIQLQG